jgi:long-chain acyl-CoA synthetase
MGLYDVTFYDVVNRNAICHPTRPAWFEAEDKCAFTFSDVKHRVDALAADLIKSGVKKGSRIGVVGKNCFEFFIVYGAAAAAGAIVVPINWRLSAREIAFNLNDCEPVCLFVDSEFETLILEIQTRLSIKKYYNLRPGEGTFHNAAPLADKNTLLPLPEVSSDDGFIIIHTAAVAGRPRGALLSHRNVLCAGMEFMVSLELTADDVHLNLLPLFHVGGLFMAAQSFLAGALNVNIRKFDARQAVQLIADKQVSVFFDFAPILDAILKEQAKTGLDISSLKAVIGLDTPETIQRYQNLAGGTFYTMYGQTETSCLATIGPFNNRPGAAGKPVFLARVTLLDDTDQVVSPGEIGEIALRGPMVFKGYWGLEADTARTFRRNWHHTGDLGRFDDDGFLWYTGRKAEKELIKPGGENVYPAEVEEIILEHPAIEQTVVFGVPDPKWKEGIKAVCILKPGHRLSSIDLIEFVGSRIARFKKPQYVEFTDKLHFTPDGGMDRAKVKELFGGEQTG